MISKSYIIVLIVAKCYTIVSTNLYIISKSYITILIIAVLLLSHISVAFWSNSINFNLFQSTRSILVPFNPLHFCSVQFNPFWSISVYVDPFGPLRFIGSTEVKSVHFGPFRSNLINFSPIQSIGSIQFTLDNWDLNWFFLLVSFSVVLFKISFFFLNFWVEKVLYYILFG